MHAHTHVYSCVSFAGGLIPLPFVPSDACRRVAPCSRPCRPCRMNWTALERTTSNSMRKSNFCRATQAEYVWEILSDVQFGLLAQNKPSLGVSVADECLIWIGLPSCVSSLLQAGGSDDTVMRYSSQYEERLDPFASFSKRVKVTHLRSNKNVKRCHFLEEFLCFMR